MNLSPRLSVPLAASAVVAGAALTGCGHPAVTDALAHLTPAQAVNAAAVTGLTGSYDYTLQSSVHIGATGLPAAAQGALSAIPAITISASGTVESPQRAKMDMTAGSGSPVHIVVYDGTFFVSTDGTTYKDAPALSQMLGNVSTQQMQDLARHATHVVDAGPTQAGGISGERFTGSIDPSFVNVLMNKVAAPLASTLGMPAGLMDEVVAAMHVDAINVAFVVDHATGHLVSEVSHTTMSFDFAALGRALGAPAGTTTGTMTVSSDSTLTTHDVGGHIVVPHPASSGTLTPQDLGHLFGGATL